MDQPVNRYLQDAIAAEKSFESQYKRFAEQTAFPQASELFLVHADEAREQGELLGSRLQTLGGTTSMWKGLLTQAFGVATQAAQPASREEECTTQNLSIAFAIENAEVAMYEALRISAGMAGDSMTASIVERIQTQEQQAAEKVWKLIAPTAERAITVRRKDGGNIEDAVVLYLQNAEAVEKNLEDTLASFAKTGDQRDVQALMSAMSVKAKSQHERLRASLESLGGSHSVAKSILAHMLTAAPISAQMGHDESEKNTQHLMVAYAAAAAQMAMYEALQTVAKAAGDGETLKLARELQLEESEDHRLSWEKLPEAARTSSRAVLSTV